MLRDPGREKGHRRRRRTVNHCYDEYWPSQSPDKESRSHKSHRRHCSSSHRHARRERRHHYTMPSKSPPRTNWKCSTYSSHGLNAHKPEIQNNRHVKRRENHDGDSSSVISDNDEIYHHVEDLHYENNGRRNPGSRSGSSHHSFDDCHRTSQLTRQHSPGKLYRKSSSPRHNRAFRKNLIHHSSKPYRGSIPRISYSSSPVREDKSLILLSPNSQTEIGHANRSMSRSESNGSQRSSPIRIASSSPVAHHTSRRRRHSSNYSNTSKPRQLVSPCAGSERAASRSGSRRSRCESADSRCPKRNTKSQQSIKECQSKTFSVSRVPSSSFFGGGACAAPGAKLVSYDDHIHNVFSNMMKSDNPCHLKEVCNKGCDRPKSAPISRGCGCEKYCGECNKKQKCSSKTRRSASRISWNDSCESEPVDNTCAPECSDNSGASYCGVDECEDFSCEGSKSDSCCYEEPDCGKPSYCRSGTRSCVRGGSRFCCGCPNWKWWLLLPLLLLLLFMLWCVFFTECPACELPFSGVILWIFTVASRSMRLTYYSPAPV